MAYESLLTPRRQALHAAAGAALERLYAARLEDVYDRLAYHYARTAEAAKAVMYLTRFAEKAARGYAHVEAVTALHEALNHVERLPAEERDRRTLELVIQLAHPLYLLGRFQDTLDLLLQQQARLERLQDPALTGPWAFWLSHTYSYQGEHTGAEQNAQRAIAAAQQCGDEVTLGEAHYVLAKEGFWLCRFPQGITHGQQAIALLERTGEQWWLGHAHWTVGVTYYFMGEFDAFQEALETFTSIQGRFEAGHTHLDLAALAHTQGHQDATTTHLHAAHALFIALQVPRYAARTAQLAGAYGVALA